MQSKSTEHIDTPHSHRLWSMLS